MAYDGQLAPETQVLRHDYGDIGRHFEEAGIAFEAKDLKRAQKAE